MRVNDYDLDLLAKAKAAGMLSENAISDDELVREDEEFVRMPLAQRIQHVILFVSFFTLVVTGIPLMFPDSPIIHKLFFFAGSFWVRGLVHRIAGVALIGLGIFQIGYVIVSPQGNQDFKKMIPSPRDAADAINLFLCNLGLREEKPKFGKYNFIEKFEYWALVWGVFIMALTGLMLWFQEASLALVPMWALDIVRIVHGFEAILAFLAIIIWHMYNVHLNPEVFPMSKIWITGKISKEEMMSHHPLEYEEIVKARREELEIERIRQLIESVRREKRDSDSELAWNSGENEAKDEDTADEAE